MPTPAYHPDTPEVGSIWEHYKGTHYVVEGRALLEANGTTLVLYRSRHTLGPVWARPVDEFLSTIPDGRQRFFRVR